MSWTCFPVDPRVGERRASAAKERRSKGAKEPDFSPGVTQLFHSRGLLAQCPLSTNGDYSSNKPNWQLIPSQDVFPSQAAVLLHHVSIHTHTQTHESCSPECTCVWKCERSHAESCTRMMLSGCDWSRQAVFAVSGELRWSADSVQGDWVRIWGTKTSTTDTSDGSNIPVGSSREWWLIINWCVVIN